MQEFIAQFGTLAPLVFLLLASILPIFLFPAGVFTIIGGALFGFTKGAFLTIIAAIFYTNIMFLLSRHFARSYFEKFLTPRLTLKQYNLIFGVSDKKLSLLLIIFRLIPLLPNSVVSYSYGLSTISFTRYFFANLVGLIPGRLIWLNFGSSLNNIWSVEFLLATIYMVVFVGVGVAITKWMK